MAAKGTIGGILMVLLLLAGAGAGYYLMQGGSAVKDDAARIATATLGVPVTIGAVQIDKATGAMTASDVKIANPPGFKNPHAIMIQQIRMVAQPSDAALLNFSEVGVTGMAVVLEVNPEGTNLSALRRNVNAAASAAEMSPGGAVLKTVVRRADMADVLLNPVVTLSGTEAQPITLPDMVLRGMGERQGGILLSEAVAQAADHVIRVASQAAGQAGFYKGMSPAALRAMQEQLGLSKGILETAVGIFKQDMEELSGSIKKLMTEGVPAPDTATPPASDVPSPAPAQ